MRISFTVLTKRKTPFGALPPKGVFFLVLAVLILFVKPLVDVEQGSDFSIAYFHIKEQVSRLTFAADCI